MHKLSPSLTQFFLRMVKERKEEEKKKEISEEAGAWDESHSDKVLQHVAQ